MRALDSLFLLALSATPTALALPPAPPPRVLGLATRWNTDTGGVVVTTGQGELGDNLTVSGYAPERAVCPQGATFIRPSDEINPLERDWVASRLSSSPFSAYLSSVSLSPSDLNLPSSPSNASSGNASSSLPPSEPVIGLSFSGGGPRAQISGGGQLYALTPGNAEAMAAGTAFLPAVAYIAGLSGGSWLTASYVAWSADNQTTLDLAEGEWNLTQNIATDAPQPGLFSAADYYASLVGAVGNKNDAGFDTGIVDYWGLALGAHLFPPEYAIGAGTPNLTMSDLRGVGPEAAPYPIIIAAERSPGQEGDRWLREATVWEFSPYEFGTWAFGGGFGNWSRNDGGAFTPEEFLGTALENGRPNATDEGQGQCTIGFDNLAFIVGTASTLFNVGYAALANSSTDRILANAIEAVLSSASSAGIDIARVPNPTINFRSTTNPLTNASQIDLVDAGETLQNVPLEPLLAPAREVDVIVAFDNSADNEFSWPNGTAIAASQTRFTALRDSLVSLNVTPAPGPLFLPTTPADANAFVNGGFNSRPTFFGCSEDPSPSARDMSVPLIVYVPNAPWSAYSNVSTFQLQYTQNETDEVFWNGVRTMTLNGSLASNWSTCLSCALADRAVFRAGNNRSTLCTDCFSQWCWDTPPNTTTPPTYEPTLGTIPSFLESLGATAGPALGSNETTGGGNSSTVAAVDSGAPFRAVGRVATSLVVVAAYFGVGALL